MPPQRTSSQTLRREAWNWTLPPHASMPIQNSEKIPSGSAFDQGNTWLPLGKLRTLVCSKDFFETHGHGILALTRAVCKENFDQPSLNKDLVNALYIVEVIDTYGGPSGPEAMELHSQLNSPLVQQFWEGRSSVAGCHKSRSRQVHTEYYWRREPPRPEHAANGWVVLTNGVNDVSVPKIGLIPLLDLDLAEVERGICAVNGMIIQAEEVRKIKKGILVSMYQPSEPEASKLAELMETCNIEVAAERMPTATATEVDVKEAGQDPASSNKSETSIIEYPIPRSGDKGHRPHRAKRLPAVVIDDGSHHQVPPPTSASKNLDADIGKAEMDTARKDTTAGEEGRWTLTG